MKLKNKLFGMILCVMVMTGVIPMSVMAEEKMSSVTIYGLEYPVQGKKLDTNYTLPSSGISYTKDTTVDAGVKWYDQGTQIGTTTSGDLITDADYTAVKGHYYMAELHLCDVKYLDNSVDSYVYFADNVSVVYEEQNRLKNSSVYVTNQESQATVYLFFKADPVYDGYTNYAIINTDKVPNDGKDFKIGAGTKPWTVNDFDVSETDDYKISLEWYKGTGDSKNPMSESESFVAGQMYTLRVTLNSDFADKNAYFDNEEGFLWLFINNTPGETYQIHAMSMSADFELLAQSSVEEVSIEGIKLPEAYTDMQTTGFTVGEGVTISDVQWYKTSGVEFDTEVTGKFQPSTNYRLGLTLQPKDGYIFNLTQEDVSVNVGNIGKYSAGANSIVVYIDFKIGAHTCSYTDTWQMDGTNHWKACVCGKKGNVEAHTYDAGVVTNEATETKTGVKTYTCTVCKHTKTETIPVVEKKEEPKGEQSQQPNDQPNEQPKAPAKNAVIKDKTGVSYKVTKAGTSGATVEFKAPKNKKVTKVTIPSTVVINGITYKVTSIAANAFVGCKKLTTVTIGKNVTKIGAKAFYGCKKLKKITIKTTKLKSKTVGKNAFKGTPKSAKVKVPAKSLKAYKKFLYKKGFNKKAKITK